MKKRVLSIILVAVMVFLMMPNVMAADSVLAIKAGNVEIAKGTKTVEVDIEITSNPGVATLGFDVSYDGTALTLKSVKNGEIFADDELDSNTAKNPFIISAVCGTGDVTSKGVLATLVFEVNNSAATGTYDITLSENATLGGYFNYNEVLVPATLTSGTVKIKAATTISGTFKSFGSASDATTIELVSGSTVIDTKKVTGNSGSYSFAGMSAGNYKVRVSKTKHATREYDVTVSNSNVIQNVQIWLYGDVTADGIANNGDVLQINRYTANLSSVFESQDMRTYLLKLANITGIFGNDSIVNNSDVLHIRRKNANLSSAFDSIE